MNNQIVSTLQNLAGLAVVLGLLIPFVGEEFTQKKVWYGVAFGGALLFAATHLLF